MHRERRIPDEVPAVALVADAETEKLWIGYALARSGLAASTSEARRLIEQGAVRVDDEVVSDGDLQLGPGEYLIQRGKRSFVRLEVMPPE